MSEMNQRSEISSRETGASQEEGSTIREDAPAGMNVQEERAAGSLSTADIASGGVGASPTAGQPEAQDQAPLFAADEAERFRSRWGTVQASFVDDPRQTVQQADALVAEVMKRLAEVFAGERSNLEQQWERGEDVSTEDLRIALQRYRSFFTRLLSV